QGLNKRGTHSDRHSLRHRLVARIPRLRSNTGFYRRTVNRSEYVVHYNTARCRSLAAAGLNLFIGNVVETRVNDHVVFTKRRANSIKHAVDAAKVELLVAVEIALANVVNRPHNLSKICVNLISH